MLQNKITLAEFKKQRKKPDHRESKLQRTCVKWFDYQYCHIRRLLFAITNGGKRGDLEAKIMQGEGVRAGVSGMILLIPRSGFSCLCIEFKTENGKQSPAQFTWQMLSEMEGKTKYVVIKSFEEFRNKVETYLAGDYSMTDGSTTDIKFSPLEQYMIQTTVTKK